MHPISATGAAHAGANRIKALGKSDRPKPPRDSSTPFLGGYEAHALMAASPEVEQDSHYVPLPPMIETWLQAGGRLTGVVGLEIGGVDFPRKLVLFRPNRRRGIKTGKERNVRLWPALKPALRN